ncbi:hypothetical protein QA596_03995 [Balneolales bacterium ANBcel1]|nr:hypothetical protein [Balneolales bacterium ANBcel1]
MKKIAVIFTVIIAISCSKEQVIDTGGTLDDIADKVHAIVLSEDVTQILGEISYNSLYCSKHELLLLVNRGSQKILVVDMEGELISSFGVEGRGPEELLATSNIGMDLECNILVYDHQNQLVKTFSRHGELINTYEPVTLGRIWKRGNYIYHLDNYYYISMEQPGWFNMDMKDISTFVKMDSSFTYFKKYGRIDQYYIKELDDMMRHTFMALDKYSRTIITTHIIIPYFKIFDVDNDYEYVGRFGYQSPNFLMSDTPMRMEHSMEQRMNVALEKSIVDSPFITKDYLVFRFYNLTKQGAADNDLSKMFFFLSIYDRTNDYEYITEVSIPYHPIAVDSDRNRLFFIDTFEADEIVIGVYELRDHITKTRG